MSPADVKTTSLAVDDLIALATPPEGPSSPTGSVPQRHEFRPPRRQKRQARRDLPVLSYIWTVRRTPLGLGPQRVELPLAEWSRRQTRLVAFGVAHPGDSQSPRSPGILQGGEGLVPRCRIEKASLGRAFAMRTGVNDNA